MLLTCNYASSAPEALLFCFVCHSVLSFCPIPNIFFLLQENTEWFSMKFAGVELVITTNRLNSYVMSEVRSGTRKHGTRQNSN